MKIQISKFILRIKSYSRSHLCLIFLFSLVSFLLSAKAKSQQSDYSIHANIIYHFTKYIDWPDNKKNGDFIIGVVGEGPLYEQLRLLVPKKTAGQQKIVIQKYASSAKTFNCHILFIGADKSGSLKKIAAATKLANILLVTEWDEAAKKGSCINFAVVNEHLKLEINKKNIEARSLHIATELLNLGIIVK